MMEVLKVIKKSLMPFVCSWCLVITSVHASSLKGWYEWGRSFFISEEKEAPATENIVGAPNGVGCSHLNSLAFNISGINELINHLEKNSCEKPALRQMASISENNQMNAVPFCRQLQDLKKNNVCTSGASFGSVGVDMLHQELQSLEEMKELEKDIITDNLQEDLEEMKVIANLQTSLSTDPIFMRDFYASVLRIGQESVEQREEFKRLFGLDDSFFFDEGPGGRQIPKKDGFMPIQEFIGNAFSCLPTPKTFSALDNELDNPNACGFQGLAAGKLSESLNEAKENLVQRCKNKEEDCNLAVNTSQDLYQSILPTISNEAKTYSSKTGTIGSIALIDPENLGINHLENTHELMAFLADPIVGESVYSQLQSVMDENVGKMEPPKLREAMQARALDVTLEMINGRSEFLQQGDNAALFEKFIQSKTNKENGNLEATFTDEILKIELAQTLGKDLNDPDIESFVGLVQQAAVGQRVGAYYHERQTQMYAFLPKLHGFEVNTGPVPDYMNEMLERSKERLQGLRSGSMTPEQAASEMAELGKKYGQSSLWKAVVELEGMQSQSDDPIIRAAYGLDNLLELFKEGKMASDSIAKEADSPIDMRERLEMTMNLTLLNMAKRAQAACQNAKRPTRISQRYCSPMSDPEYGAKGLEKLLSRDDLGSPDKLIKNALTLCIPILQENEERQILADNIDPLSDQAEMRRHDLCINTTQNLLCSGGSCDATEIDNLRVGLSEIQKGFFGMACATSDQVRLGAANTDRKGLTHSIRSSSSEDTDSLKAYAGLTGLSGLSINHADSGNMDKHVASGKRPLSDKIRSKRLAERMSRLSSGLSKNKVSQADPVKSTSSKELPQPDETASVSPYSKNKFADAKEIYGGNTNRFTSIDKDNEDEEASLVEKLSGQENELDATTKKLLADLERMQKEQREFQRQLDEAKNKPVDDPEKAELLAKIAELNRKSEDLEKRLNNSQDVKRALEVAERNKVKPHPIPVENSTFPTPAPAAKISSKGGGGATQAQTHNTVVTPINQAGGGFPGSPNSRKSVVRNSGSEDSYFDSTGAGSFQGNISGGLNSNSEDFFLTLTSELRNQTTIVAAGTSSDAAVLEVKGPVRIPNGDGTYTIYIPELTADGEVKLNEKNEVIYLVKDKIYIDPESAEGQALLAKRNEVKSGRMPASIDEAPPVEDANRRRFRNEDLDNVLEEVSGFN